MPRGRLQQGGGDSASVGEERPGYMAGTRTRSTGDRLVSMLATWGVSRGGSVVLTAGGMSLGRRWRPSGGG